MNVVNEVINQITPTRSFNLLYVILDSIFIIVLLSLLFIKKKKITLIFSLLMGILYVIVDFGGFYLLSHTRIVSFIIEGNKIAQGPLNTFLVLFWMSMSYGITNGAFIWLALEKDEYTPHFALLIFMWWIVAPMLSLAAPNSLQIVTERTTNAYHYIMAIFLIVGYGYLIISKMIKSSSPKEDVKLFIRLNLIGIAVQFGWEFALLINGIRPMNEMSLRTIIVNSLLETNLGMAYFYYIQNFINSRFNEDLSKKIN